MCGRWFLNAHYHTNYEENLLMDTTTCLQCVRKHKQNVKKTSRRLLKVLFSHKSSPFRNPFAPWDPEWEGHESLVLSQSALACFQLFCSRECSTECNYVSKGAKYSSIGYMYLNDSFFSFERYTMEIYLSPLLT